MKYIKASICSIAALSILPYIQSAENLDPLFAELKRTKKEFHAGGIVVPEDERNKKIDEGFKQIEDKIFHGNPLPEPLKKLYKKCGNLLLGADILSPLGGVTSPLHNAIRTGQEKKVPPEWIVFVKETASEYFCMNLMNGHIARFLVFPEANPFKQEDTYQTLGDWIEKILLDQ